MDQSCYALAFCECTEIMERLWRDQNMDIDQSNVIFLKSCQSPHASWSVVKMHFTEQKGNLILSSRWNEEVGGFYEQHWEPGQNTQCYAFKTDDPMLTSNAGDQKQFCTRMTRPKRGPSSYATQQPPNPSKKRRARKIKAPHIPWLSSRCTVSFRSMLHSLSIA